MEGIRSFIAIEVPQPLKARLGELQKELRRTEADVRWVRPEGVHLTLKFLGSVSTEVLEKLSLAIGPVVEAWSPFDLRIHGLGCFPSIRNARVLWVGIAQGGPEASSLQKAVEDKSAELGLQPEARPFQPHLTLGRVRSPKGRGLLAEAIESHKDAEVGIFRASEVYLFKSELRPSGAVYTKLQTFPMRGSQD